MDIQITCLGLIGLAAGWYALIFLIFSALKLYRLGVTILKMMIVIRKFKAVLYSNSHIVDIEESAEFSNLHQEATGLMIDYYQNILAWPRIWVNVRATKAELIRFLGHADEEQKNKIANLLVK